MGVQANIDFNNFPKQSDLVGKITTVIFRYDTSNPLRGQIVRDDMETPWRTIILLENGRYVLGTECQYQFVR